MPLWVGVSSHAGRVVGTEELQHADCSWTSFCVRSFCPTLCRLAVRNVGCPVNPELNLHIGCYVNRHTQVSEGDQNTPAAMQRVNIFHYFSGWSIPKDCQAAETQAMGTQAPSGSVLPSSWQGCSWLLFAAFCQRPTQTHTLPLCCDHLCFLWYLPWSLP